MTHSTGFFLFHIPSSTSPFSSSWQQQEQILMSLQCFCFFSLATFFFLCGKKQGTTSGKNVCFLKGREQTWFCGTLGNRSKRLSSGKLWANINEAFKLEKGGRKTRFELLEGYWSWIGCCKIVTHLPKCGINESHFFPYVLKCSFFQTFRFLTFKSCDLWSDNVS